jgi:hypothetical protein
MTYDLYVTKKSSFLDQHIKNVKKLSQPCMIQLRRPVWVQGRVRPSLNRKERRIAISNRSRDMASCIPLRIGDYHLESQSKSQSHMKQNKKSQRHFFYQDSVWWHWTWSVWEMRSCFHLDYENQRVYYGLHWNSCWNCFGRLHWGGSDR